MIPVLFAKKNYFSKVSVSLGGFGPSVAHGKHSVRRRCVQATKNKAETCSLLDAIGRRSCGRWRDWIKIDVWENPMARHVRFDSRLVKSVRCDTLWAWNGRSAFLLALLSVSGNHLRCLSSACIVVGAVTVTPAENFVSLSPSPLFLRVNIKKKKKVSVAARQSVHPSECSPNLPSSSGLCVRLIGKWTAVDSWRGITAAEGHGALASRLAGPDNAVPRLPGSDSWLSKKKQKKIRSLFLHVLVQFFNQATF